MQKHAACLFQEVETWALRSDWVTRRKPCQALSLTQICTISDCPSLSSWLGSDPNDTCVSSSVTKSLLARCSPKLHLKKKKNPCSDTDRKMQIQFQWDCTTTILPEFKEQSCSYSSCFCVGTAVPERIKNELGNVLVTSAAFSDSPGS